MLPRVAGVPLGTDGALRILRRKASGQAMSAVARLFAAVVSDENYRLTSALAEIAHHIGGSPGMPETVVQAAESARERLNQLTGHSGIPRDPDGQSVPYALVGR